MMPAMRRIVCHAGASGAGASQLEVDAGGKGAVGWFSGSRGFKRGSSLGDRRRTSALQPAGLYPLNTARSVLAMSGGLPFHVVAERAGLTALEEVVESGLPVLGVDRKDFSVC